MTVIVAYANGSITWIGSDTATVSSGGRVTESGKKWFTAHGWGYGHCGDCRVADLLLVNADKLFADLASPYAFADRLIELYRGAGMQPRFDGSQQETVPSWCNGGILARAGEAWDVDSCCSLVAVTPGVVFGRGNGGSNAMAAAWGYQRAIREASPEVLIEAAIRGAAAQDVHIRGLWQGRIA
jgi:hypothetical protein